MAADTIAHRSAARRIQKAFLGLFRDGDTRTLPGKADSQGPARDLEGLESILAGKRSQLRKMKQMSKWSLIGKLISSARIGEVEADIAWYEAVVAKIGAELRQSGATSRVGGKRDSALSAAMSKI